MASSVSWSLSAWCEGSAVLVVSGMSVMALPNPFWADRSLGDDAGQDEDRDEREPDGDDEREDQAEALGPVARMLLVGQAQGLQRAPDPVVQVGAEHRHREEVDQRQPPGVERVDEE